jgi:hypothetical protein
MLILATWLAGIVAGCAIAVADGIHDANTSNPVSVLRIELPPFLRHADADPRPGRRAARFGLAGATE